MFNLKNFLLVGACTSLSVCYAQQMEEKLPTAASIERHESKVFMGVNGGVNSPSGSYNDTAELGVSAGWHPLGQFGYGAELFTSNLESVENHQRTTALIEGAYTLGGEQPMFRYSYASFGAGPTMVGSSLEWALAPAVGIDIPLSNKVHDMVSLGLNAKYVAITNSPNSFVGSLAVKYWY